MIPRKLALRLADMVLAGRIDRLKTLSAISTDAANHCRVSSACAKADADELADLIAHRNVIRKWIAPAGNVSAAAVGHMLAWLTGNYSSYDALVEIAPPAALAGVDKYDYALVVAQTVGGEPADKSNEWTYSTAAWRQLDAIDASPAIG